MIWLAACEGAGVACAGACVARAKVDNAAPAPMPEGVTGLGVAAGEGVEVAIMLSPCQC